MKRITVVLILSVVFTIISIESSHSQDATQCNFCFRGNPKPNCCSFLIFESGWMFNISRSGERQDVEGFVITGDLGLMFNIKNSKALGGSFHIAGDDDGTSFGVGPRYRVWYKNNIAIDLSPRIMFGSSDNFAVRKFPGFSLSASLSIKDFISIDSYFQLIRYEALVYDPVLMTTYPISDTETGLYLGFSGRSYLAPIMPIFILIVASTVNIGS